MEKIVFWMLGGFLVILLTLVGIGLFAAPQSNNLSEEIILNKSYNATDGGIQIEVVNSSRALTPQNNALSPAQVWNYVYNATDGSIQVSCDNCGGGNDFAEYVNITGIAPPYLSLKNTTAEDTDGGRESEIRFIGVKSGGEESVGITMTGQHSGTGDDDKWNLTVQPTEDSTDFFQILDTDGGNPILNVDAINERVGIGTATPNVAFEVFNGLLRMTETGGEQMTFGGYGSTPGAGFLGTDDANGLRVVTAAGAANVIKAGSLVINASFGQAAPTNGAYISGNVGIGVDPDTKLDVNGAITARELSADPSDPDEGSWAIWMSDGTGSGDDGDIMVKITAGSTKTITLIDFSTF